MPPEQCPECRRFLARAFVSSLEDAPSGCPGCGVELTADRFARTADGSVRPPDLPPEDVRDEDDPVAGWDVGVPAGIAAVRDERPFPTDTVVVAGAAVLGAVLGATFGRRPVRDALLAGLGGAVGAGVVRRVWQLP